MRLASKITLAALTLLLLASMGGGFVLLPLLVPFHIWAARDSGSVGRVLWCTLPVASAGVLAWAATYVTIGERQTLIWLLPVLAMATCVLVLQRAVPRPAGDAEAIGYDGLLR